MTTREKTSKLLAEFKGQLKRIYGDRLKGVFLYGSQARGEATSQSDVDIIVVLDDWNRYLLELKRTGAIASELSLASGMSISRVFVRERDWLANSYSIPCQRPCRSCSGMNEISESLVRKAERSIEAAETLATSQPELRRPALTCDVLVSPRRFLPRAIAFQ